MALKKIKLPDNSVVEVQDSRISGVDSTPTSESANIVTSGGVYDALAGKQDIVEIRYSQTEDVSEYNIAVLEDLLNGSNKINGMYPLIMTMDGTFIAAYAIQYVKRIDSGEYHIGVTTMDEAGFLKFSTLKIENGVYVGYDYLGDSLTAFWLGGLNYGSEGEEHTVTGTVSNLTTYANANSNEAYYYINDYGLSYGYNKQSGYYECFFSSGQRDMRLRVYSDGHVTTTWNNKANYYKPSTGIPVSDIASTDIDSSPTANSTNLVTSGGVAAAISNKGVNSTDTSSKIFLVGATAQGTDAQTYSDNEIYATNGVLTTKSVQVGGTSAAIQYNSTDKSIEFIFS